MKLFLMRHGEAGSAKNDKDRVLTTFGQEQTLKMAELLISENISKVLVSDFLRAQQTAKVVINALSTSEQSLNSNLTSSLKTSKLLQPGGMPEKAMEFISSQFSASTEQSPNILVVCHLPIISYLAGLAIDGVRSEDYWVKPSSIICLSAEFAELGCFKESWIKQG